MAINRPPCGESTTDRKELERTDSVQAGEEGIRRIAAEEGELMLNSPGPVAGAILGTVFSRLCEEARASTSVSTKAETVSFGSTDKTFLLAQQFKGIGCRLCWL